MTIRFDRDGRVAVVTIDRPERLNALDHHAYAELSDAWSLVRDDPDIWAAVVTGAGDRAFCVGADLTEAETVTDTDGRGNLWRLWQTQSELLLNSGMEVWKPVVAAVNGYCLGGGMTLLLATDLRVAAESATFAVSETGVGLIPGNGGTQRLLDQVPYAVGMEMLLLGRRLTAAEAASYGLVNAVTPAGETMDIALSYARRVCERAPLAVRAAKELAVRGRSLPIGEGLRLEQLTLAALRSTEDAAEGRRAFREKRSPTFEGR